MGLSSSSSRTTSNTSQNTNQAENATTTPVAPDWLTQAAQDYVGRIGAFGDMDPNGFVAPASPLQNMAWNNAGSLGDWKGQAATAAQLALGAGQQAPNYAGAGGAMGRWAGMSGLVPSARMSGPGGAQAAADALGGDKILPAHSSPLAAPRGAFSGAGAPSGPAFTYRAPTVQSPAAPSAYGAVPASLGNAPLVSGQGYSAPQLGQAGSYAAARPGAPIGASAQGYASTAIGAPNIAPTQGASASNADPASLLSNLAAYQNPYTRQIVDASLADYDQQAGRALAANQANAARNGALGGSRYAIEDAQLQSDQARGRANLEASLLSQGFNAAAGLSQADAANRQAASLFNAQNQTGISQFNAGQDAARAQAQAGLGMQANLANQQSYDNEGQFQAAAQNAAAQQYADAANRAALDYAGRADQASQFGLSNQQQRDLAQAGLSADAAKYGADSGMQAALANQGLAEQYGLARFGADSQSAQNEAAARNAASLAGYQGLLGNAQLQAQLAAQAGQYNAGANNQMAQFDAGQADAAANRALQAAGMLGSLANDYGTGTRADLATMGQLGDQQRSIEQAYAMAGPAQLQLMGQLSGMTPYDILVGRNVSGTTNGTVTGTSTARTTQSPSLFDDMLRLGNAAAQFIPV